MKLRAFHQMTYGIYLIASEFEGQKVGYIANTVFQVTSEPPFIAVSCHKNNASTEIIRKAGSFSVSALRKETSPQLIGDFGFKSGRDIDKYSGLQIIRSKTGAPVVLNDSVAWFDCQIREMRNLGSHWLMIGEVMDSELISEDEPLTYAWYREKYKILSPKNSPTYLDRGQLEEERRTSLSESDESGEVKAVAREYICVICGFTYDPAEGDPSVGIPPGTPFDELPEDYRCPVCNATKEYFRETS
jgi:flavin reductase (DIM6/NTAB) family NADH-FMN oxidoreductase RutF/rubredoxin